MVQLRGKGAMTGVNLVVKAFDNGKTKDGKVQYADVQVDHRDARAAGQTNLHLVSQRRTDKEGQPVLDKNGRPAYNNSGRYQASQMDKIAEAAGPNVDPVLNKDGERIGSAYLVKANVMPSSDGPGLVLNPNTATQSEFKADGKVLENQRTHTFEAKKNLQATAQNEATAEAEAPAPAQEAQADQEPAVG